MPQLDTTAWPPQLFWLAVTFFTLYFIVSRLIIPRTGGVIHERRAKMESDLAAAQKHKAEAHKALKAYEAELAEARQKANAIAAENRENIGAELVQKRAKASAELADHIAQAEKAITSAKDKAMADVHAVASDLTSDIVAALTGTKPSSAELSGAISKVLGK